VSDVILDGANASVSSLAFCSLNLTFAVGTTSGLVRMYKLHEHTGDSSFHFVSGSKQKIYTSMKGPCSRISKWPRIFFFKVAMNFQ
jgi:syntaxin-binding protein 5